MIFSTVPVRVTDGFPASALSVGVSLVKGLHSPGRLAAPKYRQLSASRLIFRSSRTSHREWRGSVAILYLVKIYQDSITIFQGLPRRARTCTPPHILRCSTVHTAKRKRNNLNLSLLARFRGLSNAASLRKPTALRYRRTLWQSSLRVRRQRSL